MYQWIDNHYGPMGWFSDNEKEDLENRADLTNGHWREIPQEEVDAFDRWVGRLSYQQS